MANSFTFITDSGEGITFFLTAKIVGGTVLYSDDFTTASTGPSNIYLKIYNTGDLTKAELAPENLEQGKLYDIEAFSDENFTPGNEVDITEWQGEGVTFTSFSFDVDRRPIYQGGLATQTTDYELIEPNTASFGVTTQAYRKTGATGSNDTSDTNGRLKWIEDKVLHTCDDTYSSNFERFHFTNIGGHTSINKGNQQPHFTSGAYQSLNLDKAKYFTKLSGTVANEAALPVASADYNNEYYRTTDNNHLFCCAKKDDVYSWKDMGIAYGFDTNRPYFLMDSPFTDTGVPSGTLGDSVDAWTEALTQFRAAATPADLEITSYQGYRPVFKDSTGYVPFDHQAEKVISLSKQSSNTIEPSWQGQDNGDPAFCPEPGWDGSDSDVWVPRFASYFDKEIAGIFSLGFDGIGLDTGTRVWDNAKGRANGSGTNKPNGEGSSGIVDYFNGFGIKPVFEAVGLDTWSEGDGPYPASNARYQASAYWAYFGSWWSWNNEGSPENDYNKDGSGGKIYYNNDNQTVGDPDTGGAAFDPNTSEVHCIFQWPASGKPGAEGSVAYILEHYSFTHLKQCMYDFHQAGIIVSAAGSANDFTANASTPNGATNQQFAAADFYNFVLDLAAGNITSRPVPVAEPLQKITMVISAGSLDSGTLENVSGSDIISSTKTNQWDINGGVRLWNGAEAETAGAVLGSGKYAFDSATECGDWWKANYRLRYRQKPAGDVEFGPWIPTDDLDVDPPTCYASAQREYISYQYDTRTNWSEDGVVLENALGMTWEWEVYAKGAYTPWDAGQ